MSQVENLKFICCKSIVECDNVEILQPIVDILPMDIVEFLLTLFDHFQFYRFHAKYPSGGKFEKLFMRMYWKFFNKKEGILFEITPKFSKQKDLNECSNHYWKLLVALAMRTEVYLANFFSDICSKGPHLVHDLKMTNRKLNDVCLDRLSRLTNVRYVSIQIRDSSNVKKMLRLAKKWRKLQKIKLEILNTKTLFWHCLKEFLEFKMRNNESIILSIDGKMVRSPTYIFDMLSFLGDAIYGISGLKLKSCAVSPRHRHILPKFSNVKRFEEIKFRHCRDIGTCLVDFTNHTPLDMSGDNTLSSLYFENIELPLENYIAFQHWKFSTIENFYMSDVHVGHDGAALLAKHATFWPFIIRFILRNCKIPGSGIEILLPAMVRGRGCEHLVELSLFGNRCHMATIKAFSKFLNIQHVRKLKILHMFRYHFEMYSLPLEFLNGMGKFPLVDVYMGDIVLNMKEFHGLMHCMLTASESQLRKITLCVPTWFDFDMEQHRNNLKELVENNKLSFLHSNKPGIRDNNDMLRIEKNGKIIELFINV